MQWIAIHENVLGSKLRGFRKRIKCSEAEALGILTLLWLWARKNANKDGLLGNTDKEDISDALRPSIRKELDADVVTEALINEGWIDEDNGFFYIHDWTEWQSFWYTYLEKKEKDRLRKKAERDKKKEETSKVEETDKKSVSDKKDKKITRSKNKIEFAKYVLMTQKEYDTLVNKYGETFAQKCIEKLNNYKGANPKKRTYESDYRAILSWVVDEIKNRYRDIITTETVYENSTASNVNPFDNYR